MMKTIYTGVANLFKGVESVGGKLYLTESELIHRPHSLNIQTKETTIPVLDIVDVETKNTLGVVPNGLLVTTKNKTTYHFIVSKRKKWLAYIENARTNTS